MSARVAVLCLMATACAGNSTGNEGTGGGAAGGVAASGGGSGGAAGGEAGGTAGGAAGGTAGGTAGGAAGGSAGGTAGGNNPGDAGHPEFFGASRCADAGLQLCEDFESGVINPATWTQTGAASLAVSTAEHARGARALHITKTANGSAYIRETKTFPAPNNTYWARVFFKFTTLPAAPMTYSHWTIAAATGSVINGEIRIGGQLSNTRNLYGVGTDNRTQDAGTGDWTSSDKDPNNMPRAVPLNEWMCLEWLHDGQNDETRFFWDGVEHPSLHTTLTVHGGLQNKPYVLPEFSAVWFGWAEYQASTQTFDLWVDEIAVDPARIGCTR